MWTGSWTLSAAAAIAWHGHGLGNHVADRDLHFLLHLHGYAHVLGNRLFFGHRAVDGHVVRLLPLFGDAHRVLHFPRSLFLDIAAGLDLPGAGLGRIAALLDRPRPGLRSIPRN